MIREVIKVGKRGAIIIPASLRKELHIHEGDLIIAENHGNGILLKPAVALPIEVYNAKRKAKFILSNAINIKEYKKARKEVETIGLNPDDIPHHKPKNN